MGQPRIQMKHLPQYLAHSISALVMTTMMMMMRIVITSNPSPSRNLKVMLGNFRIRIRDGTEQTLNPVNIVRYWNYSHSYPQDDLMLVKLAKPANLSHKVEPLALATSNVRPGTVCLLSGLDWSKDNNGECTSHSKSGSSVIPGGAHPCLHS